MSRRTHWERITKEQSIACMHKLPSQVGLASPLYNVITWWVITWCVTLSSFAAQHWLLVANNRARATAAIKKSPPPCALPAASNCQLNIHTGTGIHRNPAVPPWLDWRDEPLSAHRCGPAIKNPCVKRKDRASLTLAKTGKQPFRFPAPR